MVFQLNPLSPNIHLQISRADLHTSFFLKESVDRIDVFISACFNFSFRTTQQYPRELSSSCPRAYVRIIYEQKKWKIPLMERVVDAWSKMGKQNIGTKKVYLIRDQSIFP